MYRAEEFLKEKIRKYENQTIKYGPQEIITKGNIRMNIILQGEHIIHITPEIGYNHRGIEKLLEDYNFFDNINLFNKIGPFPNFSHELSFVYSLEDLFDIHPPFPVQMLRIIFCECERIINHLMNITRVVKYIGGEAIYFQASYFQIYFGHFCKKILKKYLFSNFFKIGGVNFKINIGTLTLLLELIKQTENLLTDIEIMLFENGIFRQRTIGVGTITKDDAITFGLSGPNARASGVAIDMRTPQWNPVYKNIPLIGLTESSGDVYARCFVRFQEAKESINIIYTCYSYIIDYYTNIKHDQTNIDSVLIENDDDSILFFLAHLEHYPVKQIYRSFESPRGELGIHLVGNGTPQIYRCRMNSPSLKSLQIFSKICQNYCLSDIGIIFESLDILPPEIDK